MRKQRENKKSLRRGPEEEKQGGDTAMEAGKGTARCDRVRPSGVDRSRTWLPVARPSIRWTRSVAILRLAVEQPVPVVVLVLFLFVRAVCECVS